MAVSGITVATTSAMVKNCEITKITRAPNITGSLRRNDENRDESNRRAAPSRHDAHILTNIEHDDPNSPSREEGPDAAQDNYLNNDRLVDARIFASDAISSTRRHQSVYTQPKTPACQTT